MRFCFRPIPTEPEYLTEFGTFSEIVPVVEKYNYTYGDLRRRSLQTYDRYVSGVVIKQFGLTGNSDNSTTGSYTFSGELDFWYNNSEVHSLPMAINVFDSLIYRKSLAPDDTKRTRDELRRIDACVSAIREPNNETQLRRDAARRTLLNRLRLVERDKLARVVQANVLSVLVALLFCAAIGVAIGAESTRLLSLLHLGGHGRRLTWHVALCLYVPVRLVLPFACGVALLSEWRPSWLQNCGKSS